MEIVTSGKTAKTLVCDSCNCTFRYCKIDIQTYSSGKEVRCPECGNCIKI